MWDTNDDCWQENSFGVKVNNTRKKRISVDYFWDSRMIIFIPNITFLVKEKTLGISWICFNVLISYE